jgi:hypothetical protein
VFTQLKPNSISHPPLSLSHKRELILGRVANVVGARERPQNNPAGCSAVVPLLHFTAAPKVRKSGRRGQFAAEAQAIRIWHSRRRRPARCTHYALSSHIKRFLARVYTRGERWQASERASEMENKFIRGKLGERERCELVSARDVCEGPNFALAAKRQVESEQAGRQHYCRTPTGQRAALNLPDIATRALDLLMANNIATAVEKPQKPRK